MWQRYRELDGDVADGSWKALDLTRDLTRHLIVWISAILLVASAPSLVRLYVKRLQRRTRERSDAVVARFLALRAGGASASGSQRPLDAVVQESDRQDAVT
jgi:hypothetical protein